MNGYLMHEQTFVRGEDLFVESFALENSNGVVFEDDGDTAYLYAVAKDKEGQGLVILDALHIYEAGDPEVGESGNAAPSKLLIVWSRDWQKCALIIDGYCHALFDFEAHGGYNINEFPPPNEIWTKGDRKLTEELISKHF